MENPLLTYTPNTNKDGIAKQIHSAIASKKASYWLAWQAKADGSLSIAQIYVYKGGSGDMFFSYSKASFHSQMSAQDVLNAMPSLPGGNWVLMAYATEKDMQAASATLIAEKTALNKASESPATPSPQSAASSGGGIALLIGGAVAAFFLFRRK